MKIWQSHRYVWFFGYRFYYKRFYLLKIAKPLGLKSYTEWKKRRAKRHHERRKQNGEKANPNWTKITKEKLVRRDGGECRLCGQNTNLSIDHIIPLSVLKKEANHIDNLQLLCVPCHTEKDRYSNKLSNGYKSTK
jgi:5-methylcytosine-specific restriction endonuclease McrA